MNTVALHIPKSTKPINRKQYIESILSSVEEWYSDLQNRAVNYALKIGKHLIELKAESKAEGLNWSDVCERLPFTQDMAGKLMKIASNQAIQNSEHVRNLPADTATLYTIARLPAPEIEKEIKAGHITPKMTRAEASALVRTEKPKPQKQEKKASIAVGDIEARKAALMEAWRNAPPSVREWFRSEVLK